MSKSVTKGAIAFSYLYANAHAAGHAAAEAAVPTPMVVEGYRRRDVVMDGVCGFAWVVIRPATSSFARWMAKTGKARLGYGGGLHLWVSAYNQSMARKEAYAIAFARVLKDAGIDATADSRMD